MVESNSSKSHEKQHGSLDPENPDDVKTIEKFLWESKINRNEKTLDSLSKQVN